MSCVILSPLAEYEMSFVTSWYMDDIGNGGKPLLSISALLCHTYVMCRVLCHMSCFNTHAAYEMSFVSSWYMDDIGNGGKAVVVRSPLWLLCCAAFSTYNMTDYRCNHPKIITDSTIAIVNIARS